MGILGSVLGIVVLLVIAVLFSNNRKAINLRTVLGALAIQIGFAALILYVPFGRDALQATANGVSNVIAYGNEGINSVLVNTNIHKCAKVSYIGDGTF
jgi:concentrative nucleoside transporter, CNT family